MRPSARLAVLVWVPLLLAAGCGPPPAPDESPGATGSGPTPSGSTGPAFPTVPPSRTGTPTGAFEEGFAIGCGGEPGEDELIGLLRDEGILAASAEVDVVNGPLCSGDWQYLVVSVPDLDPLQVVTRGETGQLELVTAGTDVCTVEVRIQAPAGIRDVAACVS